VGPLPPWPGKVVGGKNQKKTLTGTPVDFLAPLKKWKTEGQKKRVGPMPCERGTERGGRKPFDEEKKKKLGVEELKEAGKEKEKRRGSNPERKGGRYVP